MWGHVHRQVRRLNLFRRVTALEQRQVKFMADVSTDLANLKTTLDAVAAEVPTIAAAVAAILAKLAAIPAPGSTLVAADADNLAGAVADATTIKTSLDNLNASLAPPADAPAAPTS